MFAEYRITSVLTSEVVLMSINTICGVAVLLLPQHLVVNLKFRTPGHLAKYSLCFILNRERADLIKLEVEWDTQIPINELNLK